VIRLAKIHPEYNPHNRIAGDDYLQSRAEAG